MRGDKSAVVALDLDDGGIASRRNNSDRNVGEKLPDDRAVSQGVKRRDVRIEPKTNNDLADGIAVIAERHRAPTQAVAPQKQRRIRRSARCCSCKPRREARGDGHTDAVDLLARAKAAAALAGTRHRQFRIAGAKVADLETRLSVTAWRR